MKITRNDKGYTLLLTLVLIIIIVSLFTTFAFAAVSQQKQVEKTDKSFEANTIAEMGAEHYRYIILDEYNKAIKQLRTCINSDLDKDYNACLKNAVEVDIFGIKNTLTSIEGKNHYVLKDIKSNSIFYNFVYSNKDDYNKPEELRSVEQGDQGITKYKDYFRIELIVTGTNKDTNESKTIKLNLNLPLNLLSPNNPGEGATEGGNLIPPPPKKETFPEPGKACAPEQGYLDCGSQESSDFEWPDPDKQETTLNKEILYLHGNLSLGHTSNNSFDLNGSKLYIDGDFGVQMKNNNSNQETTWLEDGTIYVYNNSNFQFLSTKNLVLSVQGDTTIQWNTLTERSRIEIGGALIFNDNNKTFTLTDTVMNIKGAVKSKNISHNNYFTLNGKSTLYLNGLSNTIDTLTVNDESKVCIRHDANFSKVSIAPDAKIYYLNLSDDQKDDRYIKLSAEQFAMQCTPGDVYESAPELNEDDITSNIEYGSNP